MAGCSPSPKNLEGLSFAARDSASAPRVAGRVMSFAGGDVLLAAPESYCFDRRSSTADSGGGFALIAMCNRLDRRNWFGARKAAVLTASIGPAAQEAAAPQAGDIMAMFPEAKLLETLSYQSTLKRGYAIVRDTDGNLIRSARTAAASASFRVSFGDGDVTARPEGASPPAPKPSKAGPKGGQGSLF